TIARSFASGDSAHGGTVQQASPPFRDAQPPLPTSTRAPPDARSVVGSIRARWSGATFPTRPRRRDVGELGAPAAATAVTAAATNATTRIRFMLPVLHRHESDRSMLAMTKA